MTNPDADLQPVIDAIEAAYDRGDEYSVVRAVDELLVVALGGPKPAIFPVPGERAAELSRLLTTRGIGPPAMWEADSP